ncbi:hypothetical protein P7K49_027558 [Saguinus oedipus]|uniref:Uncharacterized protein n=1 Tax=Saguinus oedipus TaxID=9490 RepID=A0ABQ9UAN6_SAGOE|nr:hypothetical protein P7K49_027558 [Saguinus oedipus]
MKVRRPLRGFPRLPGEFPPAALPQCIRGFTPSEARALPPPGPDSDDDGYVLPGHARQKATQARHPRRAPHSPGPLLAPGALFARLAAGTHRRQHRDDDDDEHKGLGGEKPRHGSPLCPGSRGLALSGPPRGSGRSLPAVRRR